MSDIYFSVDVETDGSIPGEFSMCSIGLSVCGIFDGKDFIRLDPEKKTSYQELKPISENFEQARLRVSRFSREDLLQKGADPKEVMNMLHSWMVKQSGAHRPVFVA